MPFIWHYKVIGSEQGRGGNYERRNIRSIDRRFTLTIVIMFRIKAEDLN